MYETGERVPQNYGLAVSYYLDAANLGQHRAEYHFGTLYDQGLGVGKDENQALDWMHKAASAGNADAIKWLADHQR